MSLASQVQKKISLERTYYPEVRRVFVQMQKDFKISVAATGLPSDATRYRGFWLTTIDKHYERTQKAFRGEVARMLKKQLEEDEKEEVLALALLRWREINTPEQADLITQTNSKDQGRALELAREALAEEGNLTPDNREMAIVGGAILARRYLARTQSITMSQTQAAAESTKFIEAEIAVSQVPAILGAQVTVSKMDKFWNTVGDSKVRDIHAAVNGQRVNLNEPFVVNNQMLMHPGDNSLGASANNVLNCRCVATYSI